MKPHSTALGGRHDNPTGDTRYYNNIFARQTDLRAYDTAALPVWMEGIVFLKGTVPGKHEKAPLLKREFDPELTVSERADGWYLTLNTDSKWATEQQRKLITTELLGKAVIPSQEFTSPDGSPVTIATDYFGRKRDKDNPFPGPFETPVNGEIKVWPKP
jgi:alpha-N-arabinofuranosidase